MPQDAWRVVIPDHHEAYISADQFIANRQRLSTNWTNAEGLSGPARRASVSCRACSSAGDRAGNASVPGGANPETATRIFLPRAAQTSPPNRSRLAPDRTGSAWNIGRNIQALRPAELAELRFDAVDPGNRLIAATLETGPNDTVQRLHDLEAELAAFERKTMRAVTAEQKQRILSWQTTSLAYVPRPSRPLEIVSAFCACCARIESDGWIGAEGPRIAIRWRRRGNENLRLKPAEQGGGDPLSHGIRNPDQRVGRRSS